MQVPETNITWENIMYTTIKANPNLVENLIVMASKMFIYV